MEHYMAIKKTIYFATTQEIFLGAVDSGRVNQALDRYSEILKRERIDMYFSEPEWSALRDMLNGSINEPAGLVRGSLAVGWEDSQLDGIAEKWCIDAEHMQIQLEALTYPQELAVIESVEAWWRAQA
jgi:hypothetical protein